MTGSKYLPSLASGAASPDPHPVDGIIGSSERGKNKKEKPSFIEVWGI